MSPSAIVETNDMAAQSTFSYAQAAKGKSTAPASNSAASTDAAAPVQDDHAPAADADTVASAEDAQTEAPLTEQVNSEAPENVEPQTAVAEKQDTESVPGSESDARSESTQSRQTESRREDDAGRLDRPWRRNEKTPRSSSNATRSVDEQDSRKARRGKKGKASEKQAGEQATDKEQETAPEPPKVELAEAPIPSVNIWHKRNEARQAKSTKSAPTPAEATANGTSSQKGEKKAEASPAPLTNGIKSHQRQASTVRAERNGPRGSRMNEKDGKSEVPPSVDDSTAWPTPETAITAIKEDSKKKAADKVPERSDRSDRDSQEDGSSSKARQKWVNLHYVPTVNFETQLPQRGTKPRGGARGGRDTTSRAATNGAAEKLPSASPANKASDSKARDASNNATSQSNAKRGSVDIASGQKKVSTNAGSDKAKDPSAQSSVSNVHQEGNPFLALPCPQYTNHYLYRRLLKLPAIVLKDVVREVEAATVDVVTTAIPSPSMLSLDLGITAKVPVLPEPKVTVLLCDKVGMAVLSRLLREAAAAMVLTATTVCLRPVVVTACLLFNRHSLPLITRSRCLWTQLSCKTRFFCTR